MIEIGIPIAIAVLVGVLLVTSYVERMYAEMGKFLSLCTSARISLRRASGWMNSGLRS